MLIAGPCSLESEEQLIQVVDGFKTLDVDVIRLGIWKPRTDPDAFQGIGEEGLKWVYKTMQKRKVRFAIEVANARQVELALRYGIKDMWIGARTTTNPFAVQEIADSIYGIKELSIMVKNPMNPDIKLWRGAIERIVRAGHSNIMAIHRGFQTGNEFRYRNTPRWDIPIRLKREMPEIPMLSDPSHLTGDKRYIHEVILYVKQLNWEGFMLEVHPNPVQALSDAKQQLTIDEFKAATQWILSEKSKEISAQNQEYRRLYLEEEINKLEAMKVHLINELKLLG